MPVPMAAMRTGNMRVCFAMDPSLSAKAGVLRVRARSAKSPIFLITTYPPKLAVAGFPQFAPDSLLM
jgi:hypothetical protein